jgi:hypothetical protein
MLLEHLLTALLLLKLKQMLVVAVVARGLFRE